MGPFAPDHTHLIACYSLSACFIIMLITSLCTEGKTGKDSVKKREDKEKSKSSPHSARPISAAHSASGSKSPCPMTSLCCGVVLCKLTSEWIY